MARITVDLDERSCRVLGRVRDYITETTGERTSIPELVQLHFVALFMSDNPDTDV